MKSITNFSFLLLACLSIGCNMADKKSNMEKDSVSNDTVTKDHVGGVETFETKLDEDAAGYLKEATYRVLMENAANQLVLKKSNNEKIKALASLFQDENKMTLSRFSRYAVNKKVILPTSFSDLDGAQIKQIANESNKALDDSYLTFLRSNCDTTLSIYKSGSSNREQDFKDLMKQEVSIMEQKIEKISKVNNSL